jgi:hypothetical protein
VRTMLTLEKEIPIAWGKEVSDLQAGLALVPALARGYRPAEKVNLEIKLRNVGKADVTITYGLLQESPPKITDAKGTPVFVTMPPILGIIVIPTERVIKAGETITLYNPAVAVESLYRGPESGPIQFVSTPTIWVEPGTYTIAFGGMVHSHPTLSTGTAEFEVPKPPQPVTTPKTPAPSDEDVAKLQGEWTVLAMEGDGETVHVQEREGAKWVIKGNEITATQAGMTGKMSFKLNPGKTPKEIDVTALDGN